MSEASRAFEAFDLDAADGAAGRALDALPEASAGATWPALVRLVCALYRQDDVEDDALRIITNAPEDIASVGRAYWILGLWHTKRADLTRGLEILRKSLDAYERLDETDSKAWLSYLIGEAYGYIGATDAGWRHHRLALGQAYSPSGNQRRVAVLLGCAMVALFEERPRTALALLEEA